MFSKCKWMEIIKVYKGIEGGALGSYSFSHNFMLLVCVKLWNKLFV